MKLCKNIEKSIFNCWVFLKEHSYCFKSQRIENTKNMPKTAKVTKTGRFLTRGTKKFFFSKLKSSWGNEWIYMSPGYDLGYMLKKFFSVKLPTSDRNFCPKFLGVWRSQNVKNINFQAEISEGAEISEVQYCPKKVPGGVPLSDHSPIICHLIY